ncbi:MAG: ZIP family zinc transporter [Chloroflexia bacterium]|nr:ZIP family zinc transporter [Chloroflexia bacterium]
MLTAALYGLLASGGFLVGSLVGCFAAPPRRLVAAVVAFGSGVLVVALTFELMEEAFAQGSAAFTIGGFLLGAAVYVAADLVLERMAARSPKREGRDPQDVKPGAVRIPETAEQAAISGTALLVGAVLNGVPENAAIGIGLAAEGPRLGLVLLGAVFLGNVPEAVSSSVGMRQEGRSRRYVLAVWGAVAGACTLATVLGYALLGDLPPEWAGALLALAAGAILAMLADTMMPEAFENGGPLVAMATAIGFACAFLLSHLG